MDAFPLVRTDFKCVVVGGASYADDHIARTSKRRQRRILGFFMLTGYLFGDGYEELGSNAAVFVETSDVGGTHPSLVEPRPTDRCIVVNDTPENLETKKWAAPRGAYSGAAGQRRLREFSRICSIVPTRRRARRGRRAAGTRALHLERRDRRVRASFLRAMHAIRMKGLVRNSRLNRNVFSSSTVPASMTSPATQTYGGCQCQITAIAAPPRSSRDPTPPPAARVAPADSELADAHRRFH